MIPINTNRHGRNRGLEVLLYKKEELKKEEPTLHKFNLTKVFSIFKREFKFQVEFHIKKTN